MYILSYSATLTPTGNVSVCVGDNVQFTCDGPMGVTAWYTTGVDGVPDQAANTAPGLNSLSRFLSPDSNNTADPSRITLLNVVLADEGAIIECQGSDGSLSETATVAVGKSISKNCLQVNFILVSVTAEYISTIRRSTNLFILPSAIFPFTWW